jgi:hypothetical protein
MYTATPDDTLTIKNDTAWKRITHLSLSLLLVLFVGGALVSPTEVQGQTTTCITVSDGDWSAPATWEEDANNDGVGDGTNCPGDYPAAGDNAVIDANHQIEVKIDLTSGGQGSLNTLTIEAASGQNTGFVLDGVSMSVSGNVTNNSSDLGVDLDNDFFGGGDLAVGGDITNSGKISVGSKNLDITGDIDNDATISVNGGTVDGGTGSDPPAAGELDNDGTLTLGGGSAHFDSFVNDGSISLGSGDITAASFSKSPSGSIDFGTTGSLEVNAGFTNGSSSSLSIQDGQLTVAGNFRNDGNINVNIGSNGGTVVFDGTNPQALQGDFTSTNNNVLNNVQVNAGATVDPDDAFQGTNSAVQIEGDLTVNGQYGSGSSEVADLIFKGEDFTINGADSFFAREITFNRQSGTSVDGAVFSKVSLTNNTTVDLIDQFEINGKLEVGTSTKLSVTSGGRLVLNNDVDIDGELDPEGGNVIMAGRGNATDDNDNVQDITGNGFPDEDGVNRINLGSLTISDDLDLEGANEDNNNTAETRVKFASNNAYLDVEQFTIDEGLVESGRPVFISQNLTVINDGDFSFVETATQERLLFDGNSQQEITTSPGGLSLSVLEIENSGTTPPQVRIKTGSDLTVAEELTMLQGELSADGVLNIRGKLRLDGGELDVSNGTTTLVSDEFDTGQGSEIVDSFVEYVDDDGDGSVDGIITGDIAYQRRLDGTENWYYLSTPVDFTSGDNDTFTEFLEEDGQNDLLTKGFPNADENTNNSLYANVRLYDETEDGPIDPAGEEIDAGWKPVSGLGANMESGRGYAVYTFDNGNGFPKVIDSRVEPRRATSFDFTSLLEATIQDGNTNITKDDGWNLLGNPYLVTLDVCKIQQNQTGGSSSSIAPTVEVWNPENSAGGQSTDGYAAYNCATNTSGGTTDAENTDIENNSPLPFGYIAPHQGFFVKATAENPTFKIDDITEVQVLNSGFFQKSSVDSGSEPPAVSLTFDLDGMAYTTSVAFTEGGSEGIDDVDGYYIDGTDAKSGLAFYTLADDGTGILINNYPREIAEEKTIPLKIDGCNYGDELSGEATIKPSLLRNLPGEWGVVLEDTETGNRVDLRAESEYTFSYTGTCPKNKSNSVSKTRGLQPPSPQITQVPVAKDGSGPNTRFELHIVPNANIPVEFSSFTGSVADNTAKLEWTTASEQNNAGFQVQRKVDGSFQNIDGAFVEGAGTTDEPQSYSYRVEDLDAGQHTFRLKQVDVDGGSSFSKETTVKVGLDSQYELKAYPNPISEQATIKFAVKESQDVTLELYNTLGQRVQVLHQGSVPSSQTRTVSLQASDLSSGLYIVRMRGESFSTTKSVTVVR